MLKVTQNKAVVTTDPTLPTLVTSDDAQAIASFPEFQFVIHPDYLVNDDLNCIERSQGGVCANNHNTEIIPGAFPNGGAGFDLSAMAALGESVFSRVVGPNPFNLNEFSVAIALMMTYSGPTSGPWDVARGANNTGFRLILNPEVRFGLYNGSSSVVIDPNPMLGATPTLFVVTYSDELGAKLYRNGDLIVTKADPVAWGDTPIFFQALRISTYFANVSQGIQSPIYATGIDLSRPEHATKLASVTSYMMREFIS